MTTSLVDLRLSSSDRFEILMALGDAVEASATYQRYDARAMSGHWQRRIDAYTRLFDVVNAAPSLKGNA